MSLSKEEFKQIHTENILDDGVYYISLGSQKDVVLTADSKDCSQIKSEIKTESDLQKFYVRSVGNGYYMIQSFTDETVVGSCNCGNTSGTDVELQEYTGLAYQKWLLVPTIDNNYNIVSAYNDLALGVLEESSIRNADIAEFDKDYSIYQMFCFERVNEE